MVVSCGVREGGVEAKTEWYGFAVVPCDGTDLGRVGDSFVGMFERIHEFGLDRFELGDLLLQLLNLLLSHDGVGVSSAFRTRGVACLCSFLISE